MKLVITEEQFNKMIMLINEVVSEDESFIDYIVSVEGKVLDEKGLHKAYKDSKGIWTIGYGHAKTGDSKVKPGLKISEKKARELLKKDLIKFEGQVKDYVNKKFPGKTMNNHQIQMLTDFAFNLGDLDKFPKFVKSVINKDWETAKKNYKRYAGGKELTDRNKKFFDKFLKTIPTEPKTEPLYQIQTPQADNTRVVQPRILNFKT